jgi:hypothetical protein
LLRLKPRFRIDGHIGDAIEECLRAGGSTDEALARGREKMQATGDWTPCGETWLIIRYNGALSRCPPFHTDDFLLLGASGQRLRLGDADDLVDILEAWAGYVADAAAEIPMDDPEMCATLPLFPPAWRDRPMICVTRGKDGEVRVTEVLWDES